MANEVEVAPLRSLDDFLLESARFQFPNVKDLDKWGNRVNNNLLYYQSNYFVLAILVFLGVGILHPSKMLCGMLAVAVAFGLFYYITNSKSAATQFKRDHPVISVLIILSGGYFIVHFFGSVVVFLFGILMPIMLVFLHASMRLRNIKNKLTNKIETIGLKTTPMGLFLDALGQEQVAGSHTGATVVQARSDLADKLEEKLTQIGQRMKINRNR
ncbi:PRA1 family protein Jwa isoform X1 [Amblyomma americanum]